MFSLPLLLAGSVLYGQNRLELSLDGAVQHALKNNKQVINASLSMLESKEAYKATIAQGLPQVDAKMDYQDFFNAKAFIGPMAFTFNPTSNLNFSVGQLVFSGSYIVGIQMSKLYQEMTAVNYKKTEADIRAQVKNAYTIVLISQQSKQILEKNIQNISDVLSKTEALVKVGIMDETDKDQIAYQKLMLENALKSSERQIEMAYNLLRLLLCVQPETDIALTDNLLQLMASADLGNPGENAFEVKNNFDFQLMNMQKNLASKSILMEKSSFLPTIAAFYSHTEKLKKPQLDFSPKNIIGFNISVPLFSGGNRYFSYNKARYKFLQSENQVSIVEDQLQIQEKQLRYNLKSAVEQYSAYKENVELARRVYDKIVLKYQQGVVSSLDVTSSNTTLLQAENAYIMSVMQVLEAKNALDKLLNKI